MFVLFILAAGITSCSQPEKKAAENPAHEQVAATYQCPMDCENGKVYDKPGQCPVCGMDLQKVESHPMNDSTHHDHEGHSH